MKRHSEQPGCDRRPARMMDWLFIRSRCYTSSRIRVYVERKRSGREGRETRSFSLVAGEIVVHSYRAIARLVARLFPPPPPNVAKMHVFAGAARPDARL